MTDYGIVTAAIIARLGEQRVLELTDDANTGSIVDAHVDAAIEAAEAELHLYAAVYYATPLRIADGITTPAGIKELLTDSACWRLMTRRPQFLRSSEDEGTFWEARRKEIVRWLTAIADADPKGRILIAGAAQPTVPVESRAGAATVVSETPRFPMTGLKGFFS